MSTPVSARNKPQGPPGSNRSARHCADAMPGPTSIPADYPVHHSGVTGRYPETRRAESIRPISKIHSFATRRRLRTATCDGDRASVRGSGVWARASEGSESPSVGTTGMHWHLAREAELARSQSSIGRMQQLRERLGRGTAPAAPRFALDRSDHCLGALPRSHKQGRRRTSESIGRALAARCLRAATLPALGFAPPPRQRRVRESPVGQHRLWSAPSRGASSLRCPPAARPGHSGSLPERIQG